MKPQVNYIGIEVNKNAKLPRHILKLLNLPTFIPYLKELCKGIWALTIFFQYLKYELIYDNLNS